MDNKITLEWINENYDKVQFHYFLGGPFSNWSSSPFEFDGHHFSNGEQGIMYQKAKLFKDYESLELILNTSNPKEAKRLGRLVKNFDEVVWANNREDLVYQVLLAKYEQNELHQSALLDTGDKILVECNKYDRIWGIGLYENELYGDSPAQWDGLNLLGIILTNIKNEIRKKYSSSSTTSSNN